MTVFRSRSAAAAQASPVPPTAQAQVAMRRPIAPGREFVALPRPAGPPPYRRELDDVLTPARRAAVGHDGALRFHCVGDTGGLVDDRPQRAVVRAMVAQLQGAAPVEFFYHLGDVVYLHGEEANYGPQFHAPYADYAAPIFAVPGNHDGDPAPESGARPLAAFLRTFCSAVPPLRDAATAVRRPVVGQPHVYWTLVHRWLWIIGLYSNVPEGGQFAADQLDWLAEELRAAPAGVTVIVAMHQPVYSVDSVHGSNLALADALDACGERAGRHPDAVFTAHAHNYQRFARRRDGHETPYIVAGSGGYHERHGFGTGLSATPATFAGLPGVRLESFQDEAHGFLTVTVSPAGGAAVYQTVSDDGARTFDRFSFGPRASG